MKQAKTGDIHIPAESLWGIDIEEEYFYKTDTIIRKAFEKSGFFNKKVSDWKKIF